MTTHTIKGVTAFACDDCSETIEPDDQSNFAAAWGEAYILGWRAFKRPWGSYEHQCPACVAEDKR